MTEKDLVEISQTIRSANPCNGDRVLYIDHGHIGEFVVKRRNDGTFFVEKIRPGEKPTIIVQKIGEIFELAENCKPHR